MNCLSMLLLVSLHTALWFLSCPIYVTGCTCQYFFEGGFFDSCIDRLIYGSGMVVALLSTVPESLTEVHWPVLV